MQNGRSRTARAINARGASLVVLVTLGAILPMSPAAADSYRLAPNTKVDVSIVQWNPTKSEYQRWEAIGGTFIVAQDGTLTLPIIGTVDVADETSTQLSARVAAALKDKVGLLIPPDVTVEVASYPPVYVVGAIAQPGEYEYRPGLTVLQALARGGGPFRSAAAAGADVLSLAGDLSIVHADFLRQLGQIARLEAEQAGADTIVFPTELTADPDPALIEEIMELERKVFAARREEMRRKLETLGEKRRLFDNEIGTLTARAAAGDDSIAIVSKELENADRLYDRGIVTLNRQSDLKRELASLRVERLGTDTDIMKVRQSASDVQRQEAAVRDERLTAVAIELRDARAGLDRLRSRKLTLARLIGAGASGSADVDHDRTLSYTVVREISGRVTEMPADEATPLLPGDVLKVAAAAEANRGNRPPQLLGAPGSTDNARRAETVATARDGS